MSLFDRRALLLDNKAGGGLVLGASNAVQIEAPIADTGDGPDPDHGVGEEGPDRAGEVRLPEPGLHAGYARPRREVEGEPTHRAGDPGAVDGWGR